MSSLSPFALIILMVVMPFLLLGLIAAVVLGDIAWKPFPLWADQFGWGDSAVTSVGAYNGRLFAAGYSRFVASFSITAPVQPWVQFFLKHYDQTGHPVWTRTLGNSSESGNDRTYNWPAISVGADGVYFTAVVNDTTHIRKYDFSGNLLWAIPVPHSNSTKVLISAGNGGLYVAGTAQHTNPSGLFLEKYDSSGTQIWSHAFGNSSGEVMAIYAEPSGIHTAGWVEQSLPGQILRGTRDGFMVTYDFNGNQIKMDEFGSVDRVDLATSVSGDKTAVYVAGQTYSYSSGFIRKYSLDGSLTRTVTFEPPSTAVAVFGTSISSDATGIYILATSRENQFVTKFDFNLSQVWSFILPHGVRAGQLSAAGSNGFYIAGVTGIALPGQRASGNPDAFVWEFSQYASLVLFGINPPYSFMVIATIPIAISLLVLRERRWRKRLQTSPRTPGIDVGVSLS